MTLIEQKVDLLKTNAVSGFLSTLKGPRTPGLAIALLEEGRLIAEVCVGLARLESEVPITSATRFHAASLAKQFTAFAVLLLEHSRELKLRDKLTRYLPWFPEFDIELIHLLQHSSGLRDQWELLEWSGWRGNDSITAEDVLKTLSRQRALNFRPGTALRYSNSGFTLLAEVVHVVSGQRFRNFMNSTVFEPLGMCGTEFYDLPGEVIEGRALAYTLDSEGQSKNCYLEFNPNLYVPGASSVLTTLDDMKRWDYNFVSRVIGSDAIFELMRGNLGTHRLQHTSFGLGFFNHDYRGQPVSYHSGNDFGFWAHYSQFRNLGLSVVALNNSNYGQLPELCSQLVEEIYSREPPLRSSPKGSTNIDTSECKEIKLTNPDTRARRACELTGFYESTVGEVRVVHESGDELMMLWGDDKPLVRCHNDTFVRKGTEEQCQFSAESEAWRLTVTTPATETSFQRIAGLDEVISLEKLIGCYMSPELDVILRIEKADTFKAQVVFPKYIAKPILFGCASVLATKDIWIRPIYEEGLCISVLVSGPRALDVRFDKL